MPTATFSNGYTDTYRGKRPVTVAWAIIGTLDNRTYATGYSIDATRAAKTAEATALRVMGAHMSPVWAPTGNSLGAVKARIECALAAGWDRVGKADDFIRAENARRAILRNASYRVEIVPVRSDGSCEPRSGK